MLILRGADIKAVLPIREAIEAMREAFGLLQDGAAAMPLRSAIDVPGGATMLVMPASVATPLGLGAKVVTLVPENVRHGRPLIHAVVLVLDDATGRPAALLEGGVLTALRTGAASGLATDLLARAEASTLAVIGAGAQASWQVEAVCAVRPITTIRLYARTGERAEALADRLRADRTLPRIEVTASPHQAIRNADVICTATTSCEPVFEAGAAPTGVHINAIGSYTAAMRELDPGLLGAARVVVDQRAAALAEAGEVVAAVQDGLLDEADVVELGAVVRGAPGRSSAEQITIFKSVGLAVQDVVAAGHVVRKAVAAGIGTRVDL